MANKLNSLIILLPSGHRQTLKVNLDTSVLQILEDVCSKHGFKFDDYALKHFNRVLDPSLVVRFCALPNNALLEMVPNKKSNLDPSSKVVLSLQVDGENERVNGEFPSDASLDCIISSLYPKFVDDCTIKVPVVVYMRREVLGSDALKATTLRNLGLISGRALLRLTFRDSAVHPEMQCVGRGSVLLKQQTTISESPTRTLSTDDSTSRVESEKKLVKPNLSEYVPDIEVVSKFIDGIIESAGSSDQCKNTFNEENLSEPPKEKLLTEPLQTSIASCSLNDKNMESSSSSRKVPSPKPMEIDGREPIDNINLNDVKYMDQHNGLVFLLEDGSSAFDIDLPDSFFDVTLDDVKLMMRDLKRNRESMENEPLRTEALRQLELQKKNKIYTKTIVRVQFPDRYIIQGVFEPEDKVSKVADFIRIYLQDPNSEFHLYTSPPKTILPFDKTLSSVSCVPSAKIYFSYVKQNTESSKIFLSEKVKPFITSQDVASVAAIKIRKSSDSRKQCESTTSDGPAVTFLSNEANKNNCLVDKSVNVASSEPGTTLLSNPTSSTSLKDQAASKPTSLKDQASSKRTSNNNEAKVPKWFKPS